MRITRRAFAAGMGVAALAAAAMRKGGMASLFAPQRPNIILFIADDMRFNAAGFAGNSIVQTPYLDKLAGEGFVFDNNFVTTAVCPVSRASIITGDYALRHGVYDFNTAIRPECYGYSLPVLMRKAGYHTGFIGKWGIGGPQPLADFNVWRGFAGQGEYYPRKSLHMTDLQTRQARKFLRRAPLDRPFFLVVSYKAPHEPLIPQERFSHLYENVIIPRAKTDNAEAVKALSPLMALSQARANYINSDFAAGPDFEQRMKNYYRLITGIDDSVGRIVEQLEGDQRFVDTSLFFTSDNGLLEGEHGLKGKWCMYEESIRVPLLMRLAPNAFADSKPAHLSAPSLNIDIAPTILDMASIPAPAHVRGASLLPLTKALSETPWRQGFYYEHPGWVDERVPGCEGFRNAEWKYIRYTYEQYAEECLYHLPKDPGEMHNLAKDPGYIEQLKHMRQLKDDEKQKILEI